MPRRLLGEASNEPVWYFSLGVDNIAGDAM
jgi:hypothetical protein